VVRDRAVYEGTGGWKDGRLGQAYDLIDAVLREQHAEHESHHLLKRAREMVESADVELEKLA